MNIRNPRWTKTLHILWLALFSYWIGTLSERATDTTRYWVMMAVYVVGIAGSLYLLLHDVWKRGA